MFYIIKALSITVCFRTWPLPVDNTVHALDLFSAVRGRSSSAWPTVENKGKIMSYGNLRQWQQAAEKFPPCPLNGETCIYNRGPSLLWAMERVATRWHWCSMRKGFSLGRFKMCVSVKHCLVSSIYRILLGLIPKQTTTCIQNVMSKMSCCLARLSLWQPFSQLRG